MIYIITVILIVSWCFLVARGAKRIRKGTCKTYIDDNGYRRFSDSGRLVHRWVAEKKLGRKLRYDEVVHHINRNKLDNSPKNLHVFPNQDEHEKEHAKGFISDDVLNMFK